MKKWSFSLSACLHNRKIMMAVSLLLSIIIWVAVMSGPANIQDRTLTIPVTVDLSNTYAEQIGLRLSGEVSTDVTVVVQGTWSVISRLTPADLRARVDVSTVQKAGRQDVSLTVVRNSEIVNYDIMSFSPATVSVSCDYWSTKVLRPQVDTSRLSVADATIMQLGAPLLDPAIAADGEVTLSGPKTQLDSIETLSAVIDSTETLSAVRVFEARWEAYGKDGAPVSLENCTIAGGVTQTVSVTVPVLVSREVPLTYTVKNAPPSLASLQQRLTLSSSKLLVSGPENVLDSMTDLGNLGVLNFDNLSPDSLNASGNYVRTVPLALPESVQIINGEDTVTMTLDLSDCVTKTLSLTPDAQNTAYLKNTSGLTATVQARPLSVTLCGTAASLERITAANLSLSVDLSGATAAGQALYSARVRVADYPDVWVYYGENATGIPVYVTLA